MIQLVDSSVLSKWQNVAAEMDKIVFAQHEHNIELNKMHERCDAMRKQCEDDNALFDRYIKACVLMGTVANDTVKVTLDKITTIINKALAVIFPCNSRRVAIQSSMYRGIYPHYDAVLYADGKERDFDQSGSGLGEIVGLLFSICLIDISGGRKVLIMDEILNGLHPRAKYILRDLMLAFSKEFKFILVEYGLDVGTQYEVVNNGGTSTVNLLDTGTYYADLAAEMKKRAEVSDDARGVSVNEQVPSSKVSKG